MTKLASIEKIHSIQPHPNQEVEKLEVVKIKEWPVVVPKGQFHEGDLVVFITIDSVVPESNPYFEFMSRKFRVWSAKFRGAPSQGLVCPLSILPAYVPPTAPYENFPEGIHAYKTDIFNSRELEKVEEGNDVSTILKITKYEKPLDLSVRGDAKGRFPTHLISTTDEDNLLSNPETLNEFMGEECYLTLKADGSSVTVIYENSEVRVCSRKLEQKEGTGFWTIVQKYDLPNKLKRLNKAVAIQAEACGGKIQGNPLGLSEPAIFVFNVKELDIGKWYGLEEIEHICSILDIPTVKLICEPFVFDNTWTIEKLQGIANTVTYGEDKKGEGIVLRTVNPKWSVVLGKPLSVKIINQEYKQ